MSISQRVDGANRCTAIIIKQCLFVFCLFTFSLRVHRTLLISHKCRPWCYPISFATLYLAQLIKTHLKKIKKTYKKIRNIDKTEHAALYSSI